MNILVTGAKGMVGTALVNNLKNIRDNKNRTRPGISIGEIYEYDLDMTFSLLRKSWILTAGKLNLYFTWRE